MEEINVGIPRSRNEIHGNGLQSVTTVDIKQPQQSWVTIFAGCFMIIDLLDQVDRFLQSNCLQSITVFQKAFSPVEYI